MFDQVIHGVVADGPMQGEVISQPGDGSVGFGHCTDNDESTYVHYHWEPLEWDETVDNELDDRVITGRWALDENESEFVEIDGHQVRGIVLSPTLD